MPDLAQQADVPLVMTYLDQPRKRSGIGPVFQPTGVGAGVSPRLFAGEVVVLPTAPSGGDGMRC